MPMTRTPEPSPAYRMGQHDFLTMRVHLPRVFRHADLQREYDHGYYDEKRDLAPLRAGRR